MIFKGDVNPQTYKLPYVDIDILYSKVKYDPKFFSDEVIRKVENC